jgi:hypothetical protein
MQRLKILGIVFLAIIVASIFVAPIFAQQVPQTTEEIQTWLTNPWVLFGLMIFGSILSATKQLSVAKMEGSAATIGAYLGHFQELFIMLGGNTIAFFMLVDGGNLNFVSAVSIGYAINSVADMNPFSDRSSTIIEEAPVSAPDWPDAMSKM